MLKKKMIRIYLLCQTAFMLSVLTAACGIFGEKSTVEEAREQLYQNRFLKVDLPLTLKRGDFRTTYFLDDLKNRNGSLKSFVVQVWNNNTKHISLDEWKAKELDNLRISIAPCERGKASEVPAGNWKQIFPDPGKKPVPADRVLRAPVKLLPGNYLMVAVPFSFLENYPLKTHRGQLAVKVELNLHSVKAKELIFELNLFRQKRQRTQDIIL